MIYKYFKAFIDFTKFYLLKIFFTDSVDNSLLCYT